MIEAARLVGFGVGFLVLFGALGSGLTLVLARKLPARLVLSPIIGFALAASVLSIAALIMSMKTAAWALLLPGTVASVALAIRVGRQELRHDLRELAAPISLVIVGLSLALIPGLLHGTVGPTSIPRGIPDAGYYINLDTWLRDHSLNDALPAEAKRYDLTLVAAYTGGIMSGARIGPQVVTSAASVIFGANSPDETHLALLGTLYALLPASIWFAARTLGVSRVPASVGAFFGLSPALLHMVSDSALSNLGALLLVPAALILGSRSVLYGTISEICLTVILVSGLVAVFPEFLPPLFLIGGLGTVALVLSRIVQHGLQPPFLLALGRRITVLVVGVVLVSFANILRAAKWFAYMNSPDVLTYLPDRFLTLKNVGAWAFGLIHIYDLMTFDLLSGPQLVLTIGLPVLLSLFIFWGALRKGTRGALFVLGPIGASLSLGLYTYSRYQDGHCHYCAWKSFTFMLPFLGLGIALSLQQLKPILLRRESFARAVAVGMAFVVFLGAAAIVREDAKLMLLQYQSPLIVRTDLRVIANEVDKLPQPATILLEGADASGFSAFMVTAWYYVMRGENTKISFDVTPEGIGYLVGPSPEDEEPAYYASDYSYVVTAFPGLRSNRTLIAQQGPYAVFERAPIDVAIFRTGRAWDPNEGRRAIPWVINPFELWISSEQSGPAALSLRLAKSQDNDPSLSFSLDGKEIIANQSADGSLLCVEVPLKEGRTVLNVTPQLDPQVVVRANTQDPFSPPPKVLGLRSVKAHAGQCPAELG